MLLAVEVPWAHVSVTSPAVLPMATHASSVETVSAPAPAPPTDDGDNPQAALAITLTRAQVAELIGELAALLATD